MPSTSRALTRASLRTAAAAGAATALAVTLLQGTAGPTMTAPVPGPDTNIALTGSGNPATPGDFHGHGFDQCNAPTQREMNKWLKKSPYLAAGIYISGNQRACREQPNLTPTWVSKQLRKGWKLLPITLGPQASCQPRFPRYDLKSIDDNATNDYAKARAQGTAEAVSAVTAAGGLGIVPGSTLYYDLEGWSYRAGTPNHCSESAMAFLEAWTVKVRELGYLSGVYSSAGSGILRLDELRRAGGYTLPDQLWIARWDGKANTSTSYIPDEGWQPGGRLKQYRGGHKETYGKVTINIDSNFVDLGRGMYAPAETHCGGQRVDRPRYKNVKHPKTGAKQRKGQIKTLKCFLKQSGHYDGKIKGKYNKRLKKAIKSWQSDHGFARKRNFKRKHWVALHAQGNRHALKFGSAGSDVRRLQRALNAADKKARLDVDGRYTQEVAAAVDDYRKGVVRKKRNGIVDKKVWKALQAGQK